MREWHYAITWQQSGVAPVSMGDSAVGCHTLGMHEQHDLLCMRRLVVRIPARIAVVHNTMATLNMTLRRFMVAAYDLIRH